MQDRIDSLKRLPALVAALVAVCGGGGDSSSAATTFVFRLHGMPATEESRFSTTSPQLIARARAQLSLPEAERNLIAAGSIAADELGHYWLTLRGLRGPLKVSRAFSHLFRPM